MATVKRVAVVTGAASGIGRACIDILRAGGWRVAALDRDEASLADVRTTFAKVKDVLPLVADVCDEAAVAAAVKAVISKFGRLDGVVNSAGIAADVPALDTSVDMFKRILDVNVVGSFVVAKAAAKAMKAAKTGGAIVNISSISGLRGSKGRVAYGASKGAVVTMTQVLANELADIGVRVNAIAPGPIETNMVRQVHTAADRQLYMRYIPQARYGVPEDIAKAAAFLLDSELSGYITGEILAVDGGYRGAGIIVGRK